MLWIALAIVSIIAIILLYFIVSRRKKHAIFAKINIGDLEANAKALAISMRMPDQVGNSPKIKPLLKILKKSYKILRHKVNTKEELYEFEKWLYENYRTVKESINIRAYRQFALLPHKNKQTRILAVAELIVDGSYGDISKESISSVINTFNSHTPLHIDEIKVLKQALDFALIERISEVAQKITKYNKMKLAAKRHGIIERYSDNDAYLYWLKREGKAVNHKHVIKNSDINIENIEYSFTTSLIDNCIIVSNCIKSLKTLKNIFVNEANLEYSYANSLMQADSVYANMDAPSKMTYLDAIDKLSTTFKVSEKMIIESAFALSREHGEHFGRYLFEHSVLIRAYLFSKKTKKITVRNTRKFQGIYITAIFVLAALVAGILWFFSGSLWVGLAIFLLSFLAAIPLCEYLVQKLHKSILTRRPVPRMRLDTIPQEHSTLVVVPCYVGNQEQIKDICDNLLTLRAANGENNVQFCLLIDYRATNQAIVADDFKWNDIFSQQLSAYSDINVFVRRRTSINGKYSGFERKRGAIQALNEYLLTGNSGDFGYIMQSNQTKPAYICVLDADSKLMPQSLHSAICAMAHPLNAHYDIMAFDNKYDMNSINTVYSKQYYFDSGYEGYNSYSSYYFDAYNNAVFCGKGIYRLGNFYSKLNNVLPCGKVLSHDIIEGSILNCGSLPESVYEDCPQTFLSETSRNNRWMAGDLQLSTMISNNIKGADGKKRRINKEPIYNYLMLSNALKIFVPVAALILTILALTTLSVWFALPIIVLYGGKMLLRILERIAGINKGVRYIYVVKGIFQVILSSIYEFLLLPFHALNAIIVALQTFIRLVFIKNGELKWKTFFETNSTNNFYDYVIMILPSLLLGVGLAIIAYSNLFLLGYIALFYIAIFSLYPCGDKVVSMEKIRDKDLQLLHTYAKKTYDYFDANRADTKLICDNYQEKPFKGASQGTSPTNIGFSLLAEVSAFELGIITLDYAKDNIIEILKSIVSLKKYKGHLYNWYNIKTKQIMQPNYVSSVDSGNLLAALIVTKQFLLQRKLEGIDICSRLINAMDFSFLYDNSVNLFYIGYNTQTKEYGGHYDLLASESQILNYIMSAENNNLYTWSSLSRASTSVCGNTLLSWSGTMFEYLMPTLFYKAPRHSLIDTTSRNAITTQQRQKCKGLFGISESGYYKFDDMLNYQYHAFGNSSLSLRAEHNRCVITPYATFLAMQFKPNAAIKNLAKLYKHDCFGEFGFYEAIDFTTNKQIVASYMAHHQGMILSSIANSLCNDVICKLFLSDSSMAAGKLLLGERRPINRATKLPKDDYVYERELNFEELESTRLPQYPYEVYPLVGNNYSVVLDSCGQSLSRAKDICINKKRNRIGMQKGMQITYKDIQTGEVFSPYCTNLVDRDDYRINVSYKGVKYINGKNLVTESVYLPHCINGEVREITINNTTFEQKNYKLSLNLELSLDNEHSENAHPLFSDIFVSTQHNEKMNAVIYHRKAREQHGDKFAAVVYKTDGNCVIESNAYVVSKGELPSSMHHFGDVLYPCFGLEYEFLLNPQSKNTAKIIIMQADSIVELNNMITMCNEEHFINYAKKSAEVQALSTVAKYIKTKKAFDNCISLATMVKHYNYSNNTLQAIASAQSNAIEALGLDKTIKLLKYTYGDDAERAKMLIGIVKYLNICDIKVNLLIVYNESDEYFRPMYHKIVAECGESNESVKFLNSNDLTQDIIDCCYLDLDTQSLQLKEREIDCDMYKDTEYSITNFSVKMPNIFIESGAGGFDSEGNYVQTQQSKLPYSNVICGTHGGFIVTQNGGGYSYFGNSRQNKLSVYSNDPVHDSCSEGVYLNKDNKFYKINQLKQGGYVKHALGTTEFVTQIGLVNCHTSCYIIDNGKAKIYEVSVTNYGADSNIMNVALRISPCLGVTPNPQFATLEKNENFVKMHRFDNNERGYVKCIDRDFDLRKNTLSNIDCDEPLYVNLDNDCVITTTIQTHNEKVATCLFAISNDEEYIKSLNTNIIFDKKKASLATFDAINNITLDSKDKHLDILLSKYLQYQVVSSRLNGRVGYYQSGGAVGFRDQLQDCLAMLYTDTDYVREHILLCASKQFKEGDVLHWWHEGNVGVRTQISDDKLFLPYLVHEYIQFTGDRGILKEEVPYLEGEQLKKDQESHYCKWTQSGESASLYQHCIAAIKSALQYGEHDLLLIGSGDWNDALNGIGMQGRGESVWLSMFAYKVISDFLDYIPSQERGEYLKVMDNLYAAIDQQYVGGYYRRAFTDNGEWLGDSASKTCRIDLISQAFATIANVGKPRDRLSALKAAEELIDRDNRIIKLLTPPFNKSNYCGYISSYPSGVRENGGQYTHAAAWYIMAIAISGERQRALDLVDMINPIAKCADSKIDEKYCGEPYVLSGDVYVSGQMGWSWYTGSASWMYKVIIENIIGIKISGNEMYFYPQHLKQLGEKYLVTFKRRSATYNITFISSNKKAVKLNGINYGSSVKNGDKAENMVLRVPLLDNNNINEIVVEY